MTGYSSAAGVEAAIKAAARRAAAADPSLNVDERIRLEHFHRFLSRVFSEGEDSEWVLKGGTGMLARVPSARATHDVDLYRRGFTLDQAMADLRRLAEVDLDDHFRFAYTSHSRSVGGDGQPFTDGYRVMFDVFVGVKKVSPLRVDLVVGAGITAEITTMEPASSLDLPRLVGHPYRLYPVVDQVADKVCATMTIYGERRSSREKDLVDLVVLAVTQDVDGAALGHAIASETRRRMMEPFGHFALPADWGRGYARLARSVPSCSEHRTVALARELMERFIDPALDGSARRKSWSHDDLAWC
ncbi:nucleotidyl transferase AbiEii/AbiGii toxin family protein [Jiangella anatolica]|uniref:Nucleotidyl transferase AbiEii/AbiGii toxin family protein n=1 Tax=Jiangella anatolica TaxID=2670374 RepID=A0A2W2BFS3_9ACTN|nr:nucleotidyl transferase AbiEii/AbiGii toxin family protein [Jiangella anatolica]PZF86441.1 nucleotidyl transferase AbiEii/AbiGii toxin family protein [Jiangella anatolica]